MATWFEIGFLTAFQIPKICQDVLACRRNILMFYFPRKPEYIPNAKFLYAHITKPYENYSDGRQLEGLDLVSCRAKEIIFEKSLLLQKVLHLRSTNMQLQAVR